MLSRKRIQEYGVFDPAAVEKLVQKVHNRRLTGVRDDMALVGVLSAQLVLDQFVGGLGRFGNDATD